MNREMINISII